MQKCYYFIALTNRAESYALHFLANHDIQMSPLKVCFSWNMDLQGDIDQFITSFIINFIPAKSLDWIYFAAYFIGLSLSFSELINH